MIATDYYDRPMYEGPDILMLKDKDVKARKPHSCSWCGKGIITGEKHRVFVFLEEGKFKNERVHRSCIYGGPED